MYRAVLNLELAVRPSPDEIAAVLRHLPSSPNVLPQLCRFVHEDNASLQEVNHFLRLDPGLTARVLRIGSQLATVRGQPCRSLEDAMGQIGFNRLADMIRQVAKAQVFARPVDLYGLDAEDFWRWSVSCALAAELLAEEIGEDISVAYTLGLLHCMGIVAIDEWVRQMAPSLLFLPRDGLCDFMQSELALLGCTQADVGAAVMRRWGFPATLVEPLRCQSAPCDARGHQRMACLLIAAKWLRTIVCTDDDRRPPSPPADEVLRALGVSREQLSGFVVDLRIRLGRARNLVEAVAA